jgi:catecholate siderophore receptor
MIITRISMRVNNIINLFKGCFTMSTFNKSPINVALSIALVTCALNAQAGDKVNELAVTKVQETKTSQYKVDKVASHKIATDLVDTPKTITVISSDLLEDQGITSFAAALRNVSGVSTFGAGEGGGGNITTNDKLTIRGFSANQNIYVDGIRDVSGYSRDMFNFEQLEVSKGASSSISGKGSSGGSVNLVTKQAKKDEVFTNVAASFDEKQSLRLSVDTNQKVSDIATARVNALITDGGDYLDNGVEDYKTTAIAGSVLLDVSEKTDVTLSAVYMKQDNVPMLGLPWVTEGVATALSLKEGAIDSSLWDNFYGVKGRDMEEIDMAQATLLVEHQLSDNTSIRSNTRIATNDKVSVLTRPRFASSRNDQNETVYQNEIDRTWVQAIDKTNEVAVTQLDLITKFESGDVTHDVVFGGEYYRETLTKRPLSDNTVLASNTTPYNNPVMTTFTGAVERSGEASETTGTGIALYALDTIHIGEHWLATAGLRYEDYTAKGNANYWKKVNGSWTKPLVEGVKASGEFLSYNLSIAYKPNENTNIYFGYANSQDPNGGSLSFKSSTEAQLVDTSTVKPEEAKSYELGAKWDLFDKRLQVNSALFMSNKTVLDRDENRIYGLAGEQEVKGLELGITGEINDDLSIIASYTHQKSEVTKDYTEDMIGDGLTATPEDTASVWLSYMANSKLIIAGGAQYSSGDIYWRRNRAYFDTGSVVVVNAMASYEFNDALTLQLNIDNLADKEYVTDYSAKGHFLPGAPRNIKLGVNYTF